MHVLLLVPLPCRWRLLVRRLAEMRPLEVAGRERVHHHRPDRREHRDEPREGEVVPRGLAEVGAGEAGEGVGEDVDEGRGEDDAGGEGLDEEEDGVVWVEGGKLLAQDGEGDAEEAGGEDGEDGRQLVLESLVPGVIVRFLKIRQLGFRHTLTPALGRCSEED